MILSMKWLADYVDCSVPVHDFCYDMTMSGSKVEGWKQEGQDISKVVVGKLLSVTPHENSDHLVVCQVDAGQEAPVQIVTGAPNVREGDMVPVALDGSRLPGGVKIKKGKLRGVESCGMLCSLNELGLTIHDFPGALEGYRGAEDGIFILKEEDCTNGFVCGQDIREALGLNDTIVEFEITPNRPDCLSVLGLAREAAATYNLPLKRETPAYQGGGNPDIAGRLSVTVENTDLCKRYIAAVVEDVKIGPSPRWLRERLRASGVRPINNLVDITNYVMLEYGQPMHAFDLRYVEGNAIIVRNAKAGEAITTLDGVERKLSPEMLVICDSKKPVAVAGVMGGEYSGIMEDTQTVVFESACFDRASVRLTAKALGMRTESSSRFEKGLDSRTCMSAILRACQLVEELNCGRVLPSLVDRDNDRKIPVTLPLDCNAVNRFLGTDISQGDMEEYLRRLEFTVENHQVTAPAFRMDIECAADIAEEIARLYGYNNIPSTTARGAVNARITPEQRFQRQVEQTMAGMGCMEISTFSFVSPKDYDRIRIPEHSPLRRSVVIRNPLGEDTSVMRTSILPSLCLVMAYNYNVRNLEARIFEIGKEYLPMGEDQLPQEPDRLSVGLYGGGADFYECKGIVEEVLREANVFHYEVIACDENCPFEEKTAFHPGRSAYVMKDGNALAIFGELHPEVLETYGIGVKAYAAKICLPELMAAGVTEKTYKPLPKFPAITRDLSLVCDEDIPAARLEKEIRNAVGSILEKVALFDVYQGKQIAEGKKSISYSISMRSAEGTLTDEQADQAIGRVLKALQELGAEIRS